jgi:hypothetical protein
MRNVKWLAAAALTVSVAACEAYPTASYGGYPGGGYGYSNGYSDGSYAQPTYYQQQPAYYQPAPVVQTRYVPVPVAQPAPQRRLRDSDHDGIPDRYDRDKNGDGIPDRYQRQSSR